ncbi:phosphatidic acid phosphatase type 2/haloperoxidase [Dimargaris cristalligena]|uniref:Phosphatidic acid phosphatase type 2/haloperoxidase n=1 Tax=Dimargaris cristalligena TaxID=215637 RepID=A0A4Q0A213_9FUNG|nr:phosphatidic acid phosphatase type 2/haloperoxidase [Dimargaris cristalligena]|eukprot:RKP39521.1 phosphatidic acid phosphatase type 2/haloperoxidase [Dimargaris cristalligena]
MTITQPPEPSADVAPTSVLTGKPGPNEPPTNNDTLAPQYVGSWRAACRATLLLLVQSETPLLVRIQTALRGHAGYDARGDLDPCAKKQDPTSPKKPSAGRTPSVRSPSHYRDLYFILTSLLGNHNFFLLFLPLLFWLGWSYFARTLVLLILGGIYLSSMIKDWLCLPRPPAPPLHRLTWTTSHSFEYGFPSSHTTYSVSVALFLLEQTLQITSITATSPTVTYAIISNWQWVSVILITLLATSISAGRLYCGMHSLTDVVGGLLVGATWWLVVYLGMPYIDAYLVSHHYSVPWVTVALVWVATYIFPVAIGPCLCYQDSFASLGVLVGIAIGTWSYADHPQSVSSPYLATVPYDFRTLGLFWTLVRIILGLTILVVWKITALPLLTTVLKFLTPLASPADRQQPSVPSTLPIQLNYAFDLHNLTRMLNYAGIGYLACFGVPLVFGWLHLGGVLPPTN